MELVENITWQGVPLAYIIRSQLNPAQTTFVTPPQFKQQVGFVVYPAGGEIQRHVYRPLERHLVGTSEVLIVRRGRCEIDIQRELVSTRELRQGDILLMVDGETGEPEITLMHHRPFCSVWDEIIEHREVI